MWKLGSLKDKYFVDTTKIIEDINDLIGLKDQFVCITRPRRFGKTINAMMLASYYSKNADFKGLFDKLKISKSSSYLTHLNKHNVIYITFNSNASESRNYNNYIEFYKTWLIRDIVELYPSIDTDDPINEILQMIFEKYKRWNNFDYDYIWVLELSWRNPYYPK